MKRKVLGIIIASLLATIFWGILFLIFYTGGLGLVVSILIPLGCFIVAAGIVALIEWIQDLIGS